MKAFRNLFLIVHAEQWIPMNHGVDGVGIWSPRSDMEMPMPPAPHECLRERGMLFWRYWELKTEVGWKQLYPYDWLFTRNGRWNSLSPEDFNAAFEPVVGEASEEFGYAAMLAGSQVAYVYGLCQAAQLAQEFGLPDRREKIQIAEAAYYQLRMVMSYIFPLIPEWPTEGVDAILRDGPWKEMRDIELCGKVVGK